jgi:hypothetical protein
MNNLTRALEQIRDSCMRADLMDSNCVLRLLAALEKCRKQRNAYVTDIVSWPTGTSRQREAEIKALDKEIEKLLSGERRE